MAPKLTIRNIASCLCFDQTIDLDAITMANGFKQDKKKLFASIIWMKNPRSSALVFQKGRAVVVGATNEHMALLAGIRLYRMLKTQMPTLRFHNFAVTNILATGHLGYPVDLARLAAEHPLQTNFQPTLFPGLSFEIPHPYGRGKLTANVFVGGSVVLAGACSLVDMEARLAILWKLLAKYAMRDAARADELRRAAAAAESRERDFVDRAVRERERDLEGDEDEPGAEAWA
jgi:transcription initiation factor TFIID TATA-box-binding protein